jgi:amino acid permease
VEGIARTRLSKIGLLAVTLIENQVNLRNLLILNQNLSIMAICKSKYTFEVQRLLEKLSLLNNQRELGPLTFTPHLLFALFFALLLQGGKTVKRRQGKK